MCVYKKDFLCFIFITHFSWACRSLRESQKCFSKLSFYTFTCMSNNSFGQTCISTSLMYALPVILFSACKKCLNAFMKGNKLLDTQSILMYHSLLKDTKNRGFELFKIKLQSSICFYAFIE